MTFKPRVLVATPGSELRWLGTLRVRGLFNGEHSFVFTPMPGGSTRLTQSEGFTGVLVPLLKGTFKNTLAGFETLDRALTERAESTRPAP